METTRLPEQYLTPRFFETAESLGAIGIRMDVGQIAGLDEYLRTETGQGLPAPLHRLDFAYFLSQTRQLKPWKWDKHYVDVDDSFRYYTADQLGVAPEHRMPTFKRHVKAAGKHVLELQVGDLAQPLAGPLMRALTVFHQPQDAKLAVGRPWLAVLGRGLTEEGVREGFAWTTAGSGRPDLEQEAMRRFPGALVLERR